MEGQRWELCNHAVLEQEDGSLVQGSAVEVGRSYQILDIF